MKNLKRTSPKVTQIVTKVLNDDKSSKIQKSLAGSLLSQTNTLKETGKIMEEKASIVLKSSKFNNTTKSLAGSIISQSNKKR
jgi:hypothetical protein